ncbi:MAG TPA: LamG-like jellyroll fold domain-containing protein, partial [Anaerolineae bacterium]|nr:LamG-like jellyroll fold domain-containing protein [Anaerolineae bacterium]
MNAKILLWLALGMPPIVFFVGGTVTLFDAPLNTNGISSLSTAGWPVTGVAAPAVIWDAADPTGANVGTGAETTTHAFTATGTPTAVDTPFYPDGSHSDISGCMKAMRFDGTNDYYTSNSASIASPASADFTVCAVTRSDEGSIGEYGVVAENRELVNGEGWTLGFEPTSDLIFTVENHAAAFTSRQAADNAGVNSWWITCGTSDHDGNVSAYGNVSSKQAPAAGPGGVIAPVIAMAIGARQIGSYPIEGDIAAVFFWNS